MIEASVPSGNGWLSTGSSTVLIFIACKDHWFLFVKMCLNLVGCQEYFTLTKALYCACHQTQVACLSSRQCNSSAIVALWCRKAWVEVDKPQKSPQFGFVREARRVYDCLCLDPFGIDKESQKFRAISTKITLVLFDPQPDFLKSTEDVAEEARKALRARH